ncbi:uncharacterized protein AC631_04117 [Debaryomyces fabryi]|uniref:Protein-lysine N-methyltransferase n=1 Tax=Debaryomyces fabryi TaxID=58627 RepID=A0A0V1PV20_9ASCO|nr:uncharacterized protein AC631_04117 [Debaryomyces fabryi]KSA00116.1 hypothetical protein AC631_04117 [Debaryomyces fabryi]CUM56986.1 unnamed protein product [Debaryomyces fabryi]
MTVSDLLKWAQEKGTFISSAVEFKELSQGNIGAIYTGESSDETKSSDKFDLQLPIDLAITLNKAIESFNDTGHGDFRDISKKTTNINSLLKLYLARERTSSKLNSSYFKPYLSLLPKLSDINSPYCWTSQEKALIKGTNLGNSLRDNVTQLVEEWWQVINLLPQDLPKPEEHFINMKFYYEYKFYTDDDMYNYFIVDEAKNIDNWTSFPCYLWASLILKSRSFPSHLLKDHIKDSDIKEDEAMLLPIIDLLNHNMSAKVDWSVTSSNSCTYFNFKSNSAVPGEQLYNNYGMKGNEELLLAYGFCIEDNSADSAALKIKVPLEMLPELESQGIKLPTVNDYTTSVIRNTTETKSDASIDYSQYENGLLFFITKDHLPENLVKLFQFLVKNKWENKLTLRTQLAGLNQLRQAIETKNDILKTLSIPDDDNTNLNNIRIYILSQKKIFAATIKKIKHLEKDLLAEFKSHLITLKNVYKKDLKFQQSLLISLGISSYDSIIESQFQDQCWLLYLMRCYNKNEYIKTDKDEEENYLPEWIKSLFIKLATETEVTAAEIVNYKEIYQSLIPRLSEIVPEIYGRGKWGVDEMIISAKLLDLIGFVRGKEQECILVEPFDQ